MQGESTPGPIMTREWLGWEGFPCSIIRARTTMRMAENQAPRRAQVNEWLPTLVSQPKFDGVGTSRPQATRASMHSGNRLPNGMGPPSVVQCDILSVTVARTTLPALCRVSPPPIRTCVTSSITPKRFLPVPLSRKACTQSQALVEDL